MISFTNASKKKNVPKNVVSLILKKILANIFIIQCKICRYPLIITFTTESFCTNCRDFNAIRSQSMVEPFEIMFALGFYFFAIIIWKKLVFLFPLLIYVVLNSIFDSLGFLILFLNFIIFTKGALFRSKTIQTEFSLIVLASYIICLFFLDYMNNSHLCFGIVIIFLIVNKILSYLTMNNIFKHLS
jgi:hypothetical protein